MTRTFIYLLYAVVALLTASVPGGCGGGEESAFTVRASTTMSIASPQISKRSFVADINRKCRVAWRTIADNFRQYTSWQDRPTDREALFEKAVRNSLLAGIVFHIFDEFRQVGSPPGDQRRLERIIGSLERAAELGQQGYWRARSAAQVAGRFTVFNRRAQAYGLSDCLVDEENMSGVRVVPTG